MTESEYIVATNIAKIRAAKAIVRDYFWMDEGSDDAKDQRDIMAALGRIEARAAASIESLLTE